MRELYQKILHTFLEKNGNGIRVFDSGRPGKTLGIIACTHGNEPIGLQIIDWLINEIKISEVLSYGKIICIIGNPKAAEIDQRFIDEDMNRVWNQENTQIHEVIRKKELMPYLHQCDGIIDLHSTSSPSNIMVLPLSKNSSTQEIVSQLDSNYILENIDNQTRGISLSEYHAKIHKKNISIVIECGEHSNKTYQIVIQENMKKILNYFFDLQITTTHQTIFPEIYYLFYVYSAKTFDLTYLYSSKPKSFDFIKKGEIICKNNSDVVSPQDAYIIMPSKAVDQIGSELFYLAYKK